MARMKTYGDIDEKQPVVGSIPITYHTDEELSQIARDFGRLWLWSIQRWRLYVYAPNQHPHCANRWRRWSSFQVNQ